MEADQPSLGLPYLVTVHGADRLGIVARLASVIAGAGGNITDLSTRLVGDLYVLVAEVDLPTERRMWTLCGVKSPALPRNSASTPACVQSSVMICELDAADTAFGARTRRRARARPRLVCPRRSR